MPVLIVNMGGEMVYILEQRLQAQKIPDAKGQKVLHDVVRTMYYPRFIEELFKPQEMVDITYNHLDVLKRLVGNTPQVTELLDECVRKMQFAYEVMTLQDFSVMRQALCTFFQDRKVKVSLFLHDQTQNSDGSIVVPSGGTLPAGALTPGTVRYFENGQEVSRELLPTVNSNSWKPNAGVRTQLGSNVYEKDRQAPQEELGAPSNAEMQMPPMQADQAQAAIAPTDTAKTAAAVGELNMLASLIGASPAPGGETFKLENLFGANVFSKGEGQSKPSEIIQIDGAAPSEYRQGLDSIRQQMDGLSVDGQSHPPDGLLDLMDKA